MNHVYYVGVCGKLGSYVYPTLLRDTLVFASVRWGCYVGYLYRKYGVKSDNRF